MAAHLLCYDVAALRVKTLLILLNKKGRVLKPGLDIRSASGDAFQLRSM
jgi:hypothetical protein